MAVGQGLCTRGMGKRGGSPEREKAENDE